MQRKNNILKIYPHKSRSGFAIIMAIAVIVILGTIMALSLSLTIKTSKKTTDIYLYEQSILYSKSAAELALLDIAEQGPCVNVGPYNFEGTLYTATVTLLYVYRGLDCTTFIPPANNYFTTLQTDEQSGSVLMDITVTTIAGTEPIRYFRRSIQKL